MRSREWVALVLCLFVVSVFVNMVVLSIFRVYKLEHRVERLEARLVVEQETK